MAGRVIIDIVATPSPAIVAQYYFLAAERMEDMRRPMEESVDDLAKEIEMNFEVQGRPPWEALAESTVAIRGNEGPILDDSGELRGAVTQRDAWIINVGRGEADAFLSDPTQYGGFHIEGTSTMPARDWSFTPDEVVDRVEERFVSWLEDIF